jgi:hypothetical protein
MSVNIGDSVSHFRSNLWQKLFSGRYLQSLEEDVQRLRAENRALMNSLLGTAGFPPVEYPAAPLPRELPRTRRRSWHQIQAWREAGAARNGSSDLTKQQVSNS